MPVTLLCLVKVLEELEDAASEVALQAAPNFADRLAIGCAAGDVSLGLEVAAGAGEGNQMQRPVELAVTETIEAVALNAAAGGW